ncbi:carboxypeptidase B-like [Ptychodera flava]|uniref:carboxypeptidase B-like n=1 Tax=Ptychodera flava TaxID=63121 RepID=UPI00396A4669
MAALRVTIVILAVLTFASSEPSRFDGYQVLRINPKTYDELELLHQLKTQVGDKVDFWLSPHAVGYPVDVMVPPSLSPEVTAFLRLMKIDYIVFISDVQTLIDGQRTSSQDSQQDADITFDYNRYHTYDEIDTWITDIANEYKDIVEIFEITKSYEGRRIRGLKISTSSIIKKPAGWFEAGIHAREWISPATLIYMTKYILEGYGKDDEITRMIDEFDWYIVPQLNPDGYEYSRTDNRMWRKTRQPNANSPCIGSDPNRNWDYQWGGAGASTNPCAADYRGPYALSEPEVKGVTDYLRNLDQEVKLFIDFHSYSQLWLSPWGYRRIRPADYTEQVKYAAKGVAALEAVYGTKYTYGDVANTLYVSAGSSLDWAYGVINAKYSYVLELRDTGENGFLLPEDQIEPTAIETFAGIKEAVKYVLDEF